MTVSLILPQRLAGFLAADNTLFCLSVTSQLDSGDFQYGPDKSPYFGFRFKRALPLVSIRLTLARILESLLWQKRASSRLPVLNGAGFQS